MNHGCKEARPEECPAKSTQAKAAENKAATKVAAKPAPKAAASKSAVKPGTANGAPKVREESQAHAGRQEGSHRATHIGHVRKPAATIKSVPAKSAPATPATAADTTTNHESHDESGTYYIVVEHDDLRISTDKPKSNGRVETAATFDEAKDKAMDRLIDLIDRFEHRLWEVKQSLDHETLVDRD